MFLVRIACSGCPEVDEVVVETLDELDALFCECGYGCVLLGVSEAVPV